MPILSSGFAKANGVQGAILLSVLLGAPLLGQIRTGGPDGVVTGTQQAVVSGTPVIVSYPEASMAGVFPAGGEGFRTRARLGLGYYSLTEATAGFKRGSRTGSEPNEHPVREIADRRQLMIDDRFMVSHRGLQWRVHAPRKTGEIVIRGDYPWDLGGYASVLKDGDLYHLWYTVGSNLGESAIAYARSRDGIHWERPSLNLAPSRGAPPNNIVLGLGAGGVRGGVHGCMVFMDPKAPGEERFRLVANPEEFNRQLQIFSSPDGVHWKHTHRDVITFATDRKPHHLDSQNVIFFDDRLGRYVAYVRRNLREFNAQGRSVARGEAPELKHFGDVLDLAVVFRFDDKYGRHFDPLRNAEVALADVYTNGVFKYPWAEDVYFMFPTLYYHYGGYHWEFNKEPIINAGVLDTRFAASRDGIQWTIYDNEPFIRLGMKGDFDSRRIYPVYGMVPSLDGREMFMYYMGTNETHGWGRDDRNSRLLTAAGLDPSPENRRVISRVVLRRDGPVSVHASRSGGEFLTPPLRFQGNQLVLNLDTSAAGEVQVEIQDEQGRPIPGFGLADADIIHSTNDINRVVSWKGITDIGQISGRVIRLRVVMREADLYAFQFRHRPAF